MSDSDGDGVDPRQPAGSASASTPHLARVTYLPGVSPQPGLSPLSGSSPVTDHDSERDADERQAAGGPAEERLAEGRLADEGRADEGRANATPPETEATKAADRRAARAANVSMNALTRRGLSRWELEKTLAARELEPEVIAAELDRLDRVGLIDDAALAETIVRTQHERKGLGRSAIVAELRRRHIDQDHIDVALEQLDGDGELVRARELALRRAPQVRSLDNETAKRRLSGFLMRKGYSSGIVRTAVDEALADSGGGVRFR